MSNPIIEKIRKLFRLAESSNPHEAASAAARAAELMETYKLDMADLKATPDEVGETELHEFTRFEVKLWKESVAFRVAESFDCHVFLRGKLKLVIVGRPLDIEATKYTFAYLVNEIDRLADDGWDHSFCGSPAAWKHSFRIGAAHTVCLRLMQARRDREVANEAARPEALVLVRQGRADVEKYLERYAFEKPRERGITISDGHGFEAGVEAGRGITLGPGKGAIDKGRPALQGRE